jgi:hypothetical protein
MLNKILQFESKQRIFPINLVPAPFPKYREKNADYKSQKNEDLNKY